MSDYFTSSSDVLENKLGITDSEELKKAESEICYIRQIEIETEPLPDKYDFQLLLTLHERLFGDLYSFAGQIRTVDITKGSMPFCYIQNIKSESERIFTLLQNENYLLRLEQQEFAERLAYYSSEINALHPFREGNGRTLRLFLGLLARNAGFEIQYHECNAEQLLNADIASFNGNLNPLIGIYKRIVYIQ